MIKWSSSPTRIYYYIHDKTYKKIIRRRYHGMKHNESIIEKKSGDESDIRISHILARVSMPNMIDIIFNLI